MIIEPSLGSSLAEDVLYGHCVSNDSVAIMVPRRTVSTLCQGCEEGQLQIAVATARKMHGI